MDNRVFSDNEESELDDKENLDSGNPAEPHGMIMGGIADRAWRGHENEGLLISYEAVEDAAIARIDAKRYLAKALKYLKRADEEDE